MAHSSLQNSLAFPSENFDLIEGAGQQEIHGLAQTLRDDLDLRLRRMVDSYEKTEKCLEEFQRDSGGLSGTLPSPEDAILGVFDSWISRAIRSYQAAGQGVGRAVIDRSSLNESCAYLARDITYKLRNDRIPVRDAYKEIIATYHFELLVSELILASDKLEERGLQEAADLLANDLGLNADYGREHHPKRTGRYWLFSRHLYGDGLGGYDYRLREGLDKLGAALEVAEEDSGVHGLGFSMSEIVEAFSNIHQKKYPSRTVLGQGNVMECVVFKEKIELRVDHETGDGLLAFIAMHASVRLVTIQ